jgi:nondiscriminating aspartyl-tRNA synthetase
MERIRTREVVEHVGERVLVKGWLHSLRKLGGITFIVVRDGWGTVQAVTEDERTLQTLQEANAGVESVVTLEGDVEREEQAPGGVELHNIVVEVVTSVQDVAPIAINKRKLSAQVVTLLDHASIANRHLARRAIFRLSAGIMSSFRDILTSRGFTEIQTPKIVESATESGANVFKLDYFGRAGYLAQSPQFYKQMMVGVFERVFEVGPVFRAEPHDSTRHLNEYVSLDVEFGFIEDHFSVMALLRDVLAFTLVQLSEKYGEELALLGVDMPHVAPEIPWIHFADAQELILQRHGVDVRGEPDLSPQDERWLGAWAKEEYGSDFLFVTGYPMRKRPFYTHPDVLRPEFSASFDLLFRGTELVTGGQRLHRYKDYVQAMERAGIALEPFAYYLEAFKYGMPPEGGFAIGLERLLMQLIGAASVKLTALFPRDINRLAP